MRVNKTQRAVVDLYNALWYLKATASAPTYFTEALRGARRVLEQHKELATKIQQNIDEQQRKEEDNDS
jgi:hypothetical protein